MSEAGTRPPASARPPQAPTPIRAILFDQDGTLFDFHKTWLAAYRAAAAELAELAGRGPGFVDELLSRHGYDPTTDTFAVERPLLWATTDAQAALGAPSRSWLRSATSNGVSSGTSPTSTPIRRCRSPIW